MKQALSDALKRRGYETLTSVQQAVSDPGLARSDMLVSAQTGSGKTVGFGLAIAPALLGDAEAFGDPDKPLALVIAPTRELALQVKRELVWLYGEAKAAIASCVGGMDMRDERRALARGAHIVVATPGRLRDHINRRSIDLGDVKAVVLDEADEMLDLGFREDLEFILGEAPDERQTLLFSATVPRTIAALAQKYQRDAVRVTTTEERSQHADIAYKAMLVAPRDNENAVINVLRYYEAPNALVFCNTREGVNRLKTRLSNRGFNAVALSGELSQSDRTRALQAMRDGRARVCVATDVAARGIDLPGLNLVVHADLPSNQETLLHRSGRTGRAGRKGICALIVPFKSRRKAERLLKEARVKASWDEAPSAAAVKERDQERLVTDPAWNEPIEETQRGAIEKLTGTFSPEQIAAAFLRLHQEKHSAPEELSDANAKPEPRGEFGPAAWFSLSGGRNGNADPRRLLPMLCKAGDVSKQDIGAIRIQQKETYVEIRQSAAGRFLKAIGPNMRIEGRVSVTKLDKPPFDRPRNRRPGRDAAPEQRSFPGSAAKHVKYDPMDQAYVRQTNPGGFENQGYEKPQKTAKPHRKGLSNKHAVNQQTENQQLEPAQKENGDGSRGGDGSAYPPLEQNIRKKSRPTPVGKPNSKKNKARAKAAAEAKSGLSGK